MNAFQSRPTAEQISALPGELRVHAVAVPRDDSIAEMVSWFRSERTKGGAELAGFHIAEHPVFDWFASRRQLNDQALMSAVLTRPAVRESLPQFHITDPLTYNPHTGRSPRGWSQVWPLQLPGEWATYLDAGGVYTRPDELAPADRNARSSAALNTARRAYTALVGDRYHPAITVYRTSDPWCAWFPGLLNGTWIIYDLDQRLMWLLAITDTD
ncbi:hypothetical protein GCM10011581_16970 [Saccharopolyspora subtropica]|uniref:Uncharacterized protein n=1 Tax=Saccharopolyspora thermophila TaxID=89367 RepID=A0A917JPF4_9PSEU|nr:hypothetical protein [Saccharopolyspora subtropica]GGI80324.1 hypothetical protein GCM10011581_16970 [Saccharopolyspora subtropica]